MDIIKKARELLGKPLVTAVAGFVLGLIIGLPVLGWWIWPVQYYDAAPKNLRSDLQQEYMRMIIDSYMLYPNIDIVKQRWTELGSDAGPVFMSLENDNKLQPDTWAKFYDMAVKEKLITAKASVSGTVRVTSGPGTAQPTGVATIAPTPKPTGLSNTIIGIALGISCLFLLVIIGALLYFLVFRNRKGAPRTTPRPTATEPMPSGEETVKMAPLPAEEGGAAPVAQFTTTYTLGDDIYDDSFSIDSPSGEFLGECGVGISDIVGTGEPKKVSAFEVWLFDKNDIQTVTKVLMSEHAINDATIRQRLEAKGEPILVEPGKMIELETATLRLEARIVDMNYGQGAMPANSFMDRLTVDLAVWPKAAPQQ